LQYSQTCVFVKAEVVSLP